MVLGGGGGETSVGLVTVKRKGGVHNQYILSDPFALAVPQMPVFECFFFNKTVFNRIPMGHFLRTNGRETFHSHKMESYKRAIFRLLQNYMCHP